MKTCRGFLDARTTVIEIRKELHRLVLGKGGFWSGAVGSVSATRSAFSPNFREGWVSQILSQSSRNFGLDFAESCGLDGSTTLRMLPNGCLCLQNRIEPE